MQIADAWLLDLPQQFQEKKNIEVLIRAFSRQMQEIREVFESMNERTSIESATGINLDLVGSNVSLSRTDAHEILWKNKGLEISDEVYRNVLKYGILQNTSDCTYADIVQGIKLLWGSYDLRYREDESMPATYILDFGRSSIDDATLLERRTMTIRSAGVRVLFYITFFSAFRTENVISIRRVISRLKIDHFPDIRTWDGSWTLNGMYKLDATNEKTFYTTTRMHKADWSEMIGSKRIVSVPWRLKIISSDIEVVENDAALIAIGETGFLANFADASSSIEISDAGIDAVVKNAGAETSVNGSCIRTAYSAGFLMSAKPLNGAFADDGLVLKHESDAEISLETQTIYA